MVTSDITYVIVVIGVISVIDVIGVIRFCKGPPFLLLYSEKMVPSDFTYVISVIGVIDVIGVIQFCKGPPFLLLIFWLPSFSRCEHM